MKDIALYLCSTRKFTSTLGQFSEVDISLLFTQFYGESFKIICIETKYIIDYIFYIIKEKDHFTCEWIKIIIKDPHNNIKVLSSII